MRNNFHSKLGFIGLGKMGMPMASNLINNGYDLVGYDTNRNALTNLKKVGGNIVNKIEDFGNDISIFITMLPNGDLVKKTVINLVKNINNKKSVIIIDMSSSDPIGTKQLFIFGGFDGCKWLNDICILDIGKLEENEINN